MGNAAENVITENIVQGMRGGRVMRLFDGDEEGGARGSRRYTGSSMGSCFIKLRVTPALVIRINSEHCTAISTS